MGKASKQPRAKALEKTESNSQEPNKTSDSARRGPKRTSEEIIVDHLPPMGLVFTVLVCSGFLFVYSFRDVFATGKNIGGAMDQAMLTFTNSIQFFDDEKGWKSTQGGLSSIKYITTDANNMGGLFVRKVGGAAGLTVHMQKMIPLLMHPEGAKWKMGHFRPMLWTAFLSNFFLACFYVSYMEDFVAAGASSLPQVFIALLIIESLIIAFYLLASRDVKRGPAVALEDGKTPTSVVSRIVARTVLLVSGAIAFFAARDLFFPGQIIEFVPRDDIYLEWTGALIHSPPEGSPEAEQYGMASSLQVGEKFASQSMALNLLIGSLFKFVSAFVIKYGSDGGGLMKAQMIWKGHAIGDALLLLLFRLFTACAATASVDLRWHLIPVAYETFILGLYAFF